MHRFRVVHRSWNSGFGETRTQAVPIVRQDGILRPTAQAAVEPRRRLNDVAEAGVVTVRQPVARCDFAVEGGQLAEQHGGLQTVEPGVEADPLDGVSNAALAVHADRTQQRRHLRIVGEDRAAVAVATERFGRVETGRRDRCKRADLPVAAPGAETLRGICDQAQPFGFGDLAQRFVVCRQAEQVDGQDDPRCQVAFRPHPGDAPDQIRRIHVERCFFNIDEDRRRAEQQSHLGGCGEGEARHEYRIARPDAQRHQRRHERVGTA